jgi:ATPase complex subunit ATP10
MFTNSLRKTIAPNLQHTYLISSQNMEYYRDPMGMVNARIGYVYLVDEQLRIRWAACADPTKEEIESLVKCTGVLLNRLDRRLGTTNQSTTSS